jgi:hypothetical protein
MSTAVDAIGSALFVRGLVLSDAQRGTLEVLAYSAHLELIEVSRHGRKDGAAPLQLQLDYGRAAEVVDLSPEGAVSFA